MEPPRIGREMREIDQPFQIAFEMPVIDRIKAHQRGVEPPVSFGQARTGQVFAAIGQQALQPGEAFKEGGDRLLIGVG